MPILTVEEMRVWESKTWAKGILERAVIAQVGNQIAARLKPLTRKGDLLLLLAGKGHNGDDARALEEPLKKMGRRPVLLECLNPRTAEEAFRQGLDWGPRWVVDGLFGIGLNRDLSDEWLDLVDAVNASGIPILSIDVPSGLNARTGVPMPRAVRANLTIAVGAVKTGLIQSKAWDWTGRLELEREIGLWGLPESGGDCFVAENRDWHGLSQTRSVQSHKGDYGHLCVVAGSRGYHGAAVLCARGASRAQPGLVSVYTLQDSFTPIACQLSFAMVHEWHPGCLGHVRPTAIVVGPGLVGTRIPSELRTEILETWVSSSMPMVVDAGALDWLPLDQKIAHPENKVVTPHPGEAARMLRSTSDSIQADRLGSLRQLSCRLGHVWVILKGHQTMVGKSTGQIYVNLSGNPGLAQGGSGDVLAGFIGGLLANPYYRKRFERSLAYAVHIHGRAADRLSFKRHNWNAEDLAACLNDQVTRSNYPFGR